MKNRNILIGGLIGGAIPVVALILIRISNGDWTSPPGSSDLLLYLSICFAPGFLAGAIGAHALTRIKPQRSKHENTLTSSETEEPGDGPSKVNFGKGVIGGMTGFIGLAAILLCLFLIMGYLATGN